MNNIFPNVDTTAQVAKHWDLSRSVPVPKFTPSCPICGGGTVLMRGCKFHKRDSPNPYRCDVHFKCCGCSFAWSHGVVVPEEMAIEFTMNKVLHYTDLRELLE